MRVEYLADHPGLIPTLAQWHHQQWHYLDPGTSVEQRAAWLAQHANHPQIPTTFVALSDGSLLGSASLIAHDMDTRPDLSPWMAAVYVVPEYRQQGIATALIGRIVAEAQTLGIATLYLFTPDKELFYTKRGWRLLERTSYRGVQVSVMSVRVTA
jgi:N-acetylglutamate synthase-like GNAT family acetyltransferase